MLKNKVITEANKGIATLLAFSIVPLSGLVTDIYLPSMPHMATNLGVDESKIQLTLSFFLISYGLTQFIAGSIIDALGRFKVTLICLLIFCAASLSIAITSNINLILAMRIIQGISTGFIIVSKRVFFVDVYEGEKRKNLISTMTIVWAAAPILAPFVGGYLEDYYGWRSNFYVLTGYGLLMFFLELIFSGESIKKYHALKIKTTLRTYADMLRTPDFALGIAMTGISYGLVMMYSMSGPFIIEHEMGYSPVVAGYVSLLLGAGWMVGGFTSKALLKYRPGNKSFSSLGIQILMGVIMAFAGWLGQDLFSLSVTAFVIHAAAGFIFNIFFTHCLSRFPDYAGISNGITGGGTYFVTSFLSYSAVAIFQPFAEEYLGYGYLGFSVIGIAALISWLASMKTKAATQPAS
ncbi:MFS transporter [Fulvivirga ligni]|uniref:MFS transporter n=1 Tax=Fulvivirga ligni TaxID=2904246 RepID=UPI001F3834A3|nr:MFS transporter [Fulvivirga ligni]UII20597.1 MFS transporter [Fulvivirga ligni]